MITSDLIPDELCDFRQDFDRFRHDISLEIDTEHPDLHAMTQLVDAADYARTVIGHEPRQAHVLTGRLANDFTTAINANNRERAMALCLNFPSFNATAFIAAWSALGAVGGGAPRALVGFGTGRLHSKDIFWPDRRNALRNLNSRGVMTHEYGHFLMCDMLSAEEGPSALSGLIERLLEGADDSREDDVSIHTEAFADTFAMQVVGGYNYWRPVGSFAQFGPDPADPTAMVNLSRMNYCVDDPCGNENRRGDASAPLAALPFHDELSRYTTLIHDAFDRVDAAARLTNAPWNGDVWARVPDPANPGMTLAALEFSANPYIQINDEPVSLLGSAWLDWIRHLTSNRRDEGAFRLTLLSREAFFGSLSDAMADAGFNWCDRCDVFALHSTMTAGDPGPSPTPQQRIQRWESCAPGADWDGMLVTSPRLRIETVLGDPPDPELNIAAATCAACPAHHAIGNTVVCSPCGLREVVQGRFCQACDAHLQANPVTDTCDCCPAGALLDGATNMCDPCPLGSGSDCGTTCDACPADVSLDLEPLAVACPPQRFLLSDGPQADEAICPDMWVALQNLGSLASKQELRFEATVVGPTLSEADCLATSFGFDILEPDGMGGFTPLLSRQQTGTFGAGVCTFTIQEALTASTLPAELRVRVPPPGGPSAASQFTRVTVTTDTPNPDLCAPM